LIERVDLSSAHRHLSLHPLNRGLDLLLGPRSYWDIYKTIAQEFSKMAEVPFPAVYKDVVATPLAHDPPQEIAQPLGKVRDWKKGEVEAIPGKTMPALQIVERDYTKVFDKYISLGPNLATGKIDRKSVV